MLDKIRRSLKYFIIVIGTLILLPTVLYLLLQTASVQTFLVKRISKHFSNEIKSTISIGSFEYKFFNKVSFHRILIKDNNNDTLLYTNAITAGIRRLDFKNKIYRLGKVTLIKPVIGLITDSAGQMNLTWLLSQLQSGGDTTKKTKGNFSVDRVDILDGRFSLINQNGIKSKARIDPNNLNLSNINGRIENIKIMNDTTSFTVSDLHFMDSSGLRVNKLSSSVRLAKQNINLTTTFISCGNSELNIARFGLTGDSINSFKNFTEKVKLDLLLDKSRISTTELGYFLPFADSLNETVSLSGRIMGTISELRGRNIKLAYRNFTSLDCDFDFSGLPKIENTYLYIGVNSLKTDASDLGQIRLRKGLIIIPDAIKKLGNISFNGSFNGFTTDFVTYGEIRTSKGNFRTDISLRPEKGNRYRVKGLLAGNNINLGELTGKPDVLGNITVHSNVDGYAYSFKKFEANLTGKIDSIEFNKYVYRNISLNGYFTEKTWDGSINIEDKNVKLDLLGLLNFKNTLPEFDFTLNVSKANLHKLNIDKLDSTSNVTMLLTANFKGNNIDNLDGEIKLLNSNFKKYNNSIELYNFSIRAYKENANPVLSLRTDFVDADIKGYYNFAKLSDIVKSTLNKLMPSQFHFKIIQDDTKKNNFTFNINFKNTDKINDFFKTGILISDKSYLKGAILADSAISISGNSDLISFKKNVFNNLSFDTKISGSLLRFGLKSSAFTVFGQSELKNFSVGLNTEPDNFIFRLNWDNKEQVLNQGNLIAHGVVATRPAGKRNAMLNIDIDSTHVYSDGTLWKLSKSSVLIDSSSINIHDLSLKNKDRYYLVDGTLSKNTADTVHLEFKGIDIAPLNYWINRKRNNDPSMIPLDFKGVLNGKILLTNVYRSLLLAGNITVQNFSMLGSEFGNISIKSDLDNVKKIINIEATNNLNSVKMFEITGMYDPATKKIDLTARNTKLPVTFLNPLLKAFASDISGFASGKVNMTGRTDDFILQGAEFVENASMKINYLQTKYSLNDSIRFDKEGIKFNDLKITDAKGNKANLSGFVDHKNFRDYVTDLTITINSSSFQVLNTLSGDNPLFYGTVYASGVAKIRSDPNLLSFDVSAKTGKNSKLSIPLSKGLSVSEYSYISFEDTSKLKKIKPDKSKVATVKQIPMELNMNLEVTPDAVVEIIFDSKVGDIMKGSGSSENLNVTLNKKGDFKITGDYIIEEGEYTFTFGNLFNKPFNVESGGKIMFNGNLKDAEIDLKASYLHLKTTLSPILGTSDPKFSERVSVQPQLNLSGNLFNPIVVFDIYLPDSDEETRAYLRNYISSEEEMTKQVFSLLLMNSFISQGTVNTGLNTNAPGSSSNPTGSSAISATTFEMVSSQISNWLSQISKTIDIGLNIRPGYNAVSPQEAQLALSTQILNDKVVLNGNFDVRGSGASMNNNNPLTGDFDAELKLSEKFRFKVFNRYNETYNAGTGLSPYTQGVGIFYNQDFNKFSDLFRKKKKSEMKKEDETKIKNK